MDVIRLVSICSVIIMPVCNYDADLGLIISGYTGIINIISNGVMPKDQNQFEILQIPSRLNTL